MLHEFLSANRGELLSRCSLAVAERLAPLSTQRELGNGICIFLSQLTDMLRNESNAITGEVFGPSRARESETSSSIGRIANGHGNALFRTGFTVDQVVYAYGDLCQAVTGLAAERSTLITNSEFQTLNRCLDDAIASAVSEFAREHDRALADVCDRSTNERLGFLAHEFRNLLNTAMSAVHLMKIGDGRMGGSTGAILDRSLKGLADLCTRSLADVRLGAGIANDRERVPVAEFLEEARVSAAIDAQARGLELSVADVDLGLAVDVDKQMLAGAVSNLLQNAFKFTKSHGRVCLKAVLSDDRVLIEVEDECGGLPSGDREDLFRPFEQRSGDRSGVGLGLSIARRGIETNGGRVYVRDVPGKGCVFTIDLPGSVAVACKRAFAATS
jgi:signal transduction histidine kinase